jgi:hypothetical protein
MLNIAQNPKKNKNKFKMSDREISVQEINDYADSVINQTRLLKTPRNSHSEFLDTHSPDNLNSENNNNNNDNNNNNQSDDDQLSFRSNHDDDSTNDHRGKKNLNLGGNKSVSKNATPTTRDESRNSSLSDKSNNEQIYLTHVTLSLNLPFNRLKKPALPLWKYTNVRKSASLNNSTQENLNGVK